MCSAGRSEAHWADFPKGPGRSSCFTCLLSLSAGQVGNEAGEKGGAPFLDLWASSDSPSRILCTEGSRRILTRTGAHIPHLCLSFQMGCVRGWVRARAHLGEKVRRHPQRSTPNPWLRVGREEWGKTSREEEYLHHCS